MTRSNTPSIAFLLGEPKLARNDNHERLPAAFADAGWTVLRCEHEQVSSRGGTIFLGQQPADAYDLVWPIGFGPRTTFADRLQLWSQLGARLVNHAASYITHHGKTSLNRWLPETHCAASAEALTAYLSEPHAWVLKPLAGSYGIGVTKLAPGDVTGLREVFQRQPGYYALQRFQPQIAAGEHRTLMVGNSLIGSYRRVAQQAFTANLASGGRAQRVQLGSEEHTLVTEIGQALNDVGVRFAAIDTAFPFLVEVNIANPGGLGTLNKLYGKDFGPRVVRGLQASLRDHS